MPATANRLQEVDQDPHLRTALCTLVFELTGRRVTNCASAAAAMRSMKLCSQETIDQAMRKSIEQKYHKLVSPLSALNYSPNGSQLRLIMCVAHLGKKLDELHPAPEDDPVISIRV